jgi:hypothetical protein
VKLIPLTRGMFAQVDDEDFERVSAYKWSAHTSSGTVYARRRPRVIGQRPKKESIYLHRFILRVTSDAKVDHVNHDGLDCQKSNLRTCTQSQNLGNQRIRSDNTSGAKGVRWHKAAQKWSAEIQIGRSRRWLGLFMTKEQASAAYDTAAVELFGEFAYTNRDGAAACA